MSKYLDAIQLHKHIKDRVAEAIKSGLYVKNKALHNVIIRQLIDEHDLVSEILV